jgi:pantothenate kinase-related protein Tda10
MTRDDIIRMAEEADADLSAYINYHVVFYKDQLERFATLVAAAERERMKSEGWRQCAEGQRTTQYCGQLEAAVNAERERYEREIRALQFQVDELKYKCRNLRARGESK